MLVIEDDCIYEFGGGAAMTVIAAIHVNGQPIGQLLAAPREFKTGSRGFYGQGKMVLPDGKRYQVQVQLVEIGSKEAK